MKFPKLSKYRKFWEFCFYTHPYLDNIVGTNNKDKYSNCLWGRENTHHGASGTPVINQPGHVIGIIIGGNPHPDNVSYILLSKYVQKRAMSLLYNIQSS